MSDYVEKISDSFMSTVVLYLMGAVPTVSTPSEKGATSRSKSYVFSEVSPERMAAWMAAA